MERYLSDKLMEEKDEELFEQISTLYPEAMNIAFKIKEYMQEVHHKPVPKDELTYLAVHINRLLKYSELNNVICQIKLENIYTPSCSLY
uniref:PRD domain-containing protein n=1 Tax=Marinilactibacillus psychrotolerans TaxID=191770 RepID=UPI001865A58C